MKRIRMHMPVMENETEGDDGKRQELLTGFLRGEDVGFDDTTKIDCWNQWQQ